jgi:hypothetical protein
MKSSDLVIEIGASSIMMSSQLRMEFVGARARSARAGYTLYFANIPRITNKKP